MFETFVTSEGEEVPERAYSPNKIFAAYFREIKKIKTPTAKEELKLFQKLDSQKNILLQCAFGFKSVREKALGYLEKLLSEKRSETEEGEIALQPPKAVVACALREAKEKNRKLDKLDKICRTNFLNIFEKYGIYLSVGKAEAWTNNLNNKLILHTRKKILVIKNQITSANIRLSTSIAMRYSTANYRLAPLDLIQEGNIGLLMAVGKFNYKLGVKFNTYAAYWIKQAVQRALIDSGHIIRIPVSRIEERNRIRCTKAKLFNQLGRAPSTQEISTDSNMSVENIEKSAINNIRTESANTPINKGDSESIELIDLLRDKPENNPEEFLSGKEKSEIIAHFISCLSPREQAVIRIRFYKDYTLEETGEFFNFTRERARQIEKKIIKQLRAIMQKEGLRKGEKSYEDLKV